MNARFFFHGKTCGSLGKEDRILAHRGSGVASREDLGLWLAVR